MQSCRSLVPESCFPNQIKNLLILGVVHPVPGALFLTAAGVGLGDSVASACSGGGPGDGETEEAEVSLLQGFFHSRPPAFRSAEVLRERGLPQVQQSGEPAALAV